jgi:23S rRNA-/tRNA-specific pseudouridylate synthase
VFSEFQQLYPDQPLVLAHRLDRDTSGVMLISRRPECTRLLGV